MPEIQIQISISTKYNGLNLCCGDQMSFHPFSHLGKPPKSKMLEVNLKSDVVVFFCAFHVNFYIFKLYHRKFVIMNTPTAFN